MKRKKLCNVFIATGLLAILLTACSINNETAKEPELTLEDWVQPGWMIETLASREEYAVKMVACYESKGIKGAMIENGRPLVLITEFTGDTAIDQAVSEQVNQSMSECHTQFPAPEQPIGSYESEYKKYVDLYQCLVAHDFKLPAQLSKESWLEAFGKWAPGNFGKPEIYDPYTILAKENGPYEADNDKLVNIQGTCINPIWSLGIS